MPFKVARKLLSRPQPGDLISSLRHLTIRLDRTIDVCTRGEEHKLVVNLFKMRENLLEEISNLEKKWSR